MIDLYYWTTPNGHKITIFLEEAEVEYKIIPVNIGKGDQFKPDFLRIAPNNKMPAIVDHSPLDNLGDLSIFESGAILQYLGEKTKRFYPETLRSRAAVNQWLFWQNANLGPMAGQNFHFNVYAPEKIPYAQERYINETNRLFGVLNTALNEREFVAGEYSIADMAIYPWVVPYEKLGQSLEDFPRLARWFSVMAAKKAVVRAYELASEINSETGLSDEARKILFGQTAKSRGSLSQGQFHDKT